MYTAMSRYTSAWIGSEQSVIVGSSHSCSSNSAPLRSMATMLADDGWNTSVASSASFLNAWYETSSARLPDPSSGTADEMKRPLASSPD